MKYDLVKPFQEKAVDSLIQGISYAQQFYSISKKAQVIPFTAPTGAGKTVMAAALIEALFNGFEAQYIGDKNSVVLWLSDSEDLNKQSMDKIMTFADKLVNGQCTLLNDSFKGDILEDGKIYFVNTQKFGKGNRLVTRREDRPNLIWEVFQNTIDKKGEKLVLIIDEAHRGAKKNEAKDQMSIMQRFLRGYNYTDDQGIQVKMDAFPVILGMSATIKRFDKLTESCTNLMRQQTVEVTPTELRASGLIKNNIELHIPETPSFVEMSYLRDAASEWIEKCEHWEAYKKHEPESDVKPILIIQVENADGDKITKTDIGECLNQIQDCTGITFSEGEVVHAFDTDKTIVINDFAIPNVSADTIEADKKIKVVFFKDALSTGWDCPRAEAMMSFRVAKDETYIAQLLGRMVRTPLHKKIETDDSLNNVHLFLPKFDKANADAIVKKLLEEGVASDIHINSPKKQKLQPTGMLPNGINREDVFDSLNQAKIYSYAIPKNGVHNYIKAIFRLSNLIKRAIPCKNIVSDLKQTIAQRIYAFVKELEKSGQYKTIINQIDTYIDARNEVKYDVISLGERRSLKRSFYDLDNWYKFADILLGKEGVCNTYMNNYDDEYDDKEIRCHVIAFTQDNIQMQLLEDMCKERFGNLNDEYRDKLQTNERDREEYKRIMNDEVDTTPHNLLLLDEVEIPLPEDSDVYEDHLYCDDEGNARFVLNGWEQKTLREERKKEDYVCWIRNLRNREEFLCIQYNRNGKLHPLFPDFIIVRKSEDGGFVFDLLEPHNPKYDDNIYKAKGMANYSEACKSVKRNELIRIEGTEDNYTLLRLDMGKTNVRRDVMDAADENSLNGLFIKYK